MRLLALTLLLLLCACSKTRHVEAEAAPKAAAAPPSTQLLYGGDSRAWVGPLGNMQDQSYCAANLKLPLAAEASWELGYTSAEFSAQAPGPILHYDGTLAVSARSPQLMLIDAASGKVIENKDVYVRGGDGNSQEAFRRTFFSPSGRLVAVDAANALYFFDTRSLARVWHLPTHADGDSSPLVSDAENVYAAWGDARNWNLHTVGVETGAAGWGYPFTADPENLGVTLSRSGILLGFADPSQLRAVRATDGQPLWTVHERALVALAPIDERRQQIYAVLYDESLACRDLATGTLRWRYSWADVLSDDQREDLMVRSGLRKITPQRLQVQSSAIAVTADGIYGCLQTAHVFHLSPDGQLRWQVRLDAQVVSLVAFDNALLAVQQYQIPDVQDKNKDGDLGQARPPDQFNLTPPSWPNLEPVKGVRKAVFSRVVALSRANGAILSSVDTEVASLSNLCPAGENLVFGGVRRGQRTQAAAHYITAYPWVEQ